MCMKGKQKVPLHLAEHFCKKCMATSNSKGKLCKATKMPKVRGGSSKR